CSAPRRAWPSPRAGSDPASPGTSPAGGRAARADAGRRGTGRSDRRRSPRLPGGLLPRERLPARDDHVAVARLDLEPDARAPELLGRDDGRARAEERVIHNVVRSAVVADRAGHGLDRLLRAMGRRVLVAPAVVEVPDGRLRAVADPPARAALADRVPAGLVLPVVVPPADREPRLAPDDLRA